MSCVYERTRGKWLHRGLVDFGRELPDAVASGFAHFVIVDLARYQEKRVRGRDDDVAVGGCFRTARNVGYGV